MIDREAQDIRLFYIRYVRCLIADIIAVYRYLDSKKAEIRSNLQLGFIKQRPETSSNSV